ncbi:kinesin-like protein [Pseudoscourfieldia marina]
MATAAGFPKEPPAHFDPDVQQPPLSNRSRGGGSETSSCVHVSVRVRPILPSDRLAENGGHVLTISAQPPACSPVDGALRVRTSAAFRDFAFPSVCGPEVANTELIERSGWTNLLERVFQGYGATIIAYGQTGSGKTFSMSGRIEQLAARDSAEGSSSAEEDATADDDGIIVRSLAQIFEYAKVSGAAVSATYLEVYSELVFDLWAVDETSGGGGVAGGVGGDVSSTPPTTSSSLPVRYDARNGFHVPGLRERALPSLAVARKLLLRGARNRRVRATRGNRDSSRSHSIFTVHVRVPHAAGGGACPPLLGKAVFVDLAGSERLSAGAESNVMTKETGSINRSLFALSKVISKLGAAAEQQVPSLSQSAASGDAAAMHVPYRDSTLTKLLRDSLGGNSLALLLACVSPSSRHTDETLSTLYYATRAMNIRNRPVVRVASGDNLGFQGPKGAAGSAASWLPRGGESPSAVAHAVATATSDMHRELTVLRAENARLRASVEDLTPRSIRASSDEAIIAKNNNTEQAARVDNEQLDAEEAVRRATMMAFGVEEEQEEEQEEEEEEEEREEELEQEQEREEVRTLLSTSMNSDDLRTRLAMAEAEIERLKEAAREERGRFISIAIENESLRTENEELRRRRKEAVEEEEEKVVADEEDEGEDDVAAWWEVEAAAGGGGGGDDYAAAAQEEDAWKQEQEEQEEQWKLEQQEQGQWKQEQEEEEEEEEEEERLETYVLPAAISAVPVMPVEPRYPPAEISHQTTSAVVAPPAPTAVATKSPRRQQLVTSRQSSKKTEGAITMSQRAFSLLGL